MNDFSKIIANGPNSIPFSYSQGSFHDGFEKVSPQDLFWKFEEKNKWFNSLGEFDIRTLPDNSVISFFIPAFFDFAFASLTYNSNVYYPKNVRRYFKILYSSFEEISRKLHSLENDILFSFNHYLSKSEVFGNNTESRISIVQRIRTVYAVIEKHYFHLVTLKQIVTSADKNIYEAILVLIFSIKHELIRSIEMFAIKPFKDCISSINNYQPNSTFVEPFRFFQLLISRSLGNSFYFESIRKVNSLELELDYQTSYSLSLIFNESLQPEKIQGHYITIENLISEIKKNDNLEYTYLLDNLLYIEKVLRLYSALLPKKVLPKKTEELKKQYLYLSALIDIPVSDSQKTVFIIEKNYQIFEKKIQLLAFLRGGKIDPKECQFNLFAKESEGHYFLSTILNFDMVFKGHSGRKIQESQLFYFNNKPFIDVNFRKQISRITCKAPAKSNKEYKNKILENIQSL